jgi:hypothetical protein
MKTIEMVPPYITLTRSVSEAGLWLVLFPLRRFPPHPALSAETGGEGIEREAPERGRGESRARLLDWKRR